MAVGYIIMNNVDTQFLHEYTYMSRVYMYVLMYAGERYAGERYRIAGNFRGIKLSRKCENRRFRGENFRGHASA